MALLLAKNKKALWDNALIDKYSAGISLHGYEVKAIREGNANFEGSYVQIIGGVPEVINMYIGKYSKQSKEFSEVDSRRTRQLLLNQKEIDEITREIAERGKTAVPLALVLEHNLIKLEFGIVKGRKDFEKKTVAKERQIRKDLEVETKEFKRTNNL